jgi:multidrug resistance efflux pump
MDQLPPIPVPRGHRWREFKIKQVPILIFCVALVAVVLIWKQHVAAPGFIGEVETVHANVISTLPGLLTELNVDRFDTVSKGQVIGKVFPADPELLKASLAGIEIELKTLQTRGSLDNERNKLNYEQLRLDWLLQRTELAIAKVNLQFAEAEFHRQETLRNEKIVSESEFELAQNLRDARQEEVGERARVVLEMEKRLKDLASVEDVLDTKENGSLKEAIAAQEAQLLLTEGPVTLKAPIDGVVNTVNCRAGERVMAGIPIISITSPQSGRIIAFARQPLRLVPKVGDRVEIRTRSSPRKMAIANVLSVGSGVEAMIVPQNNNKETYPNALGNPLERGLSFSVNLPDGLPVYPGETVDLVIVR